MFSRVLFFAALAALLYGCAGSPARIGMMSAAELAAVDSWDLCNAYAYNGSESARAELERRSAIPADEWVLIDKKQIAIGMSELGLMCSWGSVGYTGGVNQSVGQYGAHKQWVYRSCRYCKTKYVYTDNGKITGWQN